MHPSDAGLAPNDNYTPTRPRPDGLLPVGATALLDGDPYQKVKICGVFPEGSMGCPWPYYSFRYVANSDRQQSKVVISRIKTFVYAKYLGGLTPAARKRVLASVGVQVQVVE